MFVIIQTHKDNVHIMLDNVSYNMYQLVGSLGLFVLIYWYSQRNLKIIRECINSLQDQIDDLERKVEMSLRLHDI